MRKKLRKEIEFLKDDIKLLEKKLDKQSDANYELRKIADFLLEHDRSDVVIRNVGGLWANKVFEENDIEVSFLDHIHIRTVRIGLAFCNRAEVIKHEGDRIVIKAYNSENKDIFAYYRITKYNGEVVNVTEYYQKEEPTTAANPDTPTGTDFKYFTAEQVRMMSQEEVKANYSDVLKSMKKW